MIFRMTRFDVTLGLDWANKYLVAHFGRSVNKVLLEILDGHNGVVVNLHCPTMKQVKNQVSVLESPYHYVIIM